MLNPLRTILPDNFFLRRWWSSFKAILAAFLYSFPAKNLIVVGVTGTDGKTSTTEMIFHILKKADRSVAKISSVSFSQNTETWENTSKRTTVSPFVMQQFLANCVKKKIDIVVIEVSSHALVQNRVFGIEFNIAVLTNISAEHLDYHGNIENLRNAKKLLFTKYLDKKNGIGIINQDDEVADSWQSEMSFVKGYSLKQPAYYQGENFLNTTEGISFDFENTEFTAHVFGEFNAENALAAVSVCRELGLIKAMISLGLSTFVSTPGRLENLDFGQDFQIFVDFALTPKALESILRHLQERTSERLILVFGCAGDHDKDKRPIMGQIAGVFADIVVLTDDETYTEDPVQIREDIKIGIFGDEEISDEMSEDFYEIADRRTAIETALQLARKGDTVVVSGMGALKSRNMGGEEIPWNDKQVISDIFDSVVKEEK